MMGKKDYKEKIKVTLSIVTTILLIIAFCRDCRQDRQIESLQYTDKAMKYRPIIKIAENPIIYDKNVSLKEVIIDSVSRNTHITLILDSLKTQYGLINTGNSIAKIIAVISTDTLSAIDRLRNDLLNKKFRDIYYNRIIIKNELLELYPNDTTYVNINYPIKFIKKNEFILHLLILYKNEIGNLYDTYSWTKIKINEEFRFHTDIKLNKIYADEKIFIPYQSSLSSDVYYSKNEAQKILDSIKEITKSKQ